MNVVIFLNI